MKHFIFAAAAALLLVSCKSDEPQEPQSVTFRVSNFSYSQEPLNGPVKAPAALIDDDSQALTDLYLFDGTTQLAHQESSEENFGTITVSLLAGEHNLHFVATRSTSLSYADGVLSCASLRPTFGKHLTLNVSGSSTNNIELTRINGQVVITIEDAIPAEAKTLRIQMARYPMGLDIATFNGIGTNAFDQTVDISSKAGVTGANWKLNVLSPAYSENYETTYTITALNSGNTVIGQATGTLPIHSNTKTLLHGNLFTGTKAVFSISTAWHADINVDM